MDFKKLLGDAYSDAMTHEELFEALDKLEIKPEEDSEAETKYKNLKTRFDEVTSELAKAKKDIKAYEATANNVSTQAENRESELRDEINSLKRGIQKSKASELFAKAGLTDTEGFDGFSETLNSFIDGGAFKNDEELTNFAKNMIDVFVNTKSATEERVKNEILDGTPRPPKTEPRKLEDMTLTEKMKLKATDPNGYVAMFGGNN